MIAFTIASRAYVPHARVLARSFSAQHDGQKMWALLVDDVDRVFNEAEEPFRILHLEDLEVGSAEVHRMAMLFNTAIIAVIKPWVFDHFLVQGADVVMYIDSDFFIYDTLTPIQTAGDGVVLIPHVLQPIPRDGMDPSETTILGAGLFNAGMFGTGPNHGGFTQFLEDRLRRECIFDATRMRFNEQRWLDFVPPLFPHTIVRDPGIDVAYWNLHERPLERPNGVWHAGGQPLRAFHFSSFDPRAVNMAGRFELDPHPRVTMSTTPHLRELCGEYAAQLMENGFRELHDTPFSYETLADGGLIYGSLRDIFTEEVEAADAGRSPYPPDPYDMAQSDSFRNWMERAYAQRGLNLPHGLRPKQSRRGIMPWKRGQRSESPGSEATVRWRADWLRRMIVDSAAEKSDTALVVQPDRMGFICHGPRQPLGPGSYRATLEWEDAAATHGAELKQSLVVEAFVRGYVVGSRAVDFDELVSGSTVLDVNIPQRYEQEALVFGLEIRVLTRGGVSAQLTGLIFEALGVLHDVPSPAPLAVDWLPVMAGGVAGLRRDGRIESIAGATGVVVSGPNWRLPPGEYHVEIDLSVENQGVGDGSVITVAAVAGTKVLAETDIQGRHVVTSPVSLGFTVSGEDAGPDSQVGIVITSHRAIVASVRSIILRFVREVG